MIRQPVEIMLTEDLTVGYSQKPPAYEVRATYALSVEWPDDMTDDDKLNALYRWGQHVDDAPLTKVGDVDFKEGWPNFIRSISVGDVISLGLWWTETHTKVVRVAPVGFADVSLHHKSKGRYEVRSK